jgi:hypothetical protein
MPSAYRADLSQSKVLRGTTAPLKSANFHLHYLKFNSRSRAISQSDANATHANGTLNVFGRSTVRHLPFVVAQQNGQIAMRI